LYDRTEYETEYFIKCFNSEDMHYDANKAMQVFLQIRKNLTRMQKVKICVYLS